MRARRFRFVVATAAVVTAAVVALAGSGLLPAEQSETAVDVAELVGAVLAGACLVVTGIRARGTERRWRLFAGAGMTSWAVGQVIWTAYRATGTGTPFPSLADVGYLGLFVFVLPALLTIAAEQGAGRKADPERPEGSRSRFVLVLDGMVVVGSLLTLAWATALGAAVRSEAPSTAGFAVAVAYPITDLILVVILVLLGTVQRVRWQPSLVLLGLGLAALAVSDSLFTWQVSNGADHINPLFDAGFVVGPVLLTLAALAPPAGTEGSGPHRSAISASAHLLVPYVPLLAVGLVVVAKTAAGSGSDPLETYVGIVVVGLVVLRQLVTMRENLTLLAQVRETQGQLTHQAFHDPLTGLANRSLFGDRLSHAIQKHRRTGHPVALLFCDLDDFKHVNDTLGHAAGDELLREVARRLSGCVRAADTVARLGGDEFAVLIEGEVDLPDFVGRRLVTALQPPVTLAGATRSVRTSIGMAVAAGDSPQLSSDGLLHQADTAMYEVKRHGGGRVGSYTAHGVRLLSPETLYASAQA